MINPEAWRQQDTYFRKMTGIDTPPSFPISLAYFYENHSRALWTTSILLFAARTACIYFGKSEFALIFGELLPGPLISSMFGVLLHANQGLDNTKNRP